MTLRLLPLLLCLLAPLCRAELPGLFSYVGADTAPVTVVPNGTITLPSIQVNQTSSVTLIATNSGTRSWNLGTATVSGLPFKTSTTGGTVAAGASATIALSFTPTAGGAASGTFVLTVSADAPAESASFLFVLKGTGLAPNFVPSYILNPGGNQMPLNDQGTIAFSSIATGQTATATVIVANTGTGYGTLNSVTISGDGFQLAGLPLLPAQVTALADVRFTVSFTAKAATSYLGSLSIALDGVTRTVTLTGTGLSPQLVYETQADSGFTALAASGTLALADTAVGSTSSVTVRVRNSGTSDGQVAAIRIVSTGTAFTLSGLPSLPATLAVGQSVTFTVVFKPTDVGAADAQLFIDSFTVNLTGKGLGPQLTLTMDSGSGAATVAAGGSILFANTAVGSSSSVALKIANTGNARLTVNSITLTGTVFALTGLPGLPASLDAGQSVSFTAVFTPTGLPAATGSLQIDNTTYTLRGAGTAPPTLPAVSFQSMPATLSSLQQPSIGLKLAQAYPLGVSGTLTLTFASSVFGDDSSIQFSTGGRTVSFTIPANSTDAVFGQAGTSISFQAGTVAGTISISATLATGSVDLTPVPAPLATAQVTGAAPVIRAVQAGTRSTNSFEILITGYSNMRTVTRLTLTFTGASGANLQTGTLSVDTDSAFSAWYQSATSWTYGSQFTVSVTVNVNGKIDDVQSVSVTAANSLGVSQAGSVSLR